MREKTASFLVIVSLLVPHGSLIFAQALDTTMPTTEETPSSSTTEPMTTPETQPVTSPQADSVPPVFVSVVTSSPQETEVNVVWTTDEPAYGHVEYGETTSYGLATPPSPSAALDHTVTVGSLTPGTTYHYRIVAQDEAGNRSYSHDRVFETALALVVTDTVPPQMNEVLVTNVTPSGATIGWVTEELAQGKVEYGTSPAYTSATPVASEYRTEHSVALSGLEADTEYHFRVVVRDESGNEAVSPDEVFMTDSAPAPATAPSGEPVAEEPESADATSTPQQTATTSPSSTSPAASTTTSTTTGETLLSGATSTPAVAPEHTASSSPPATSTATATTESIATSTPTETIVPEATTPPTASSTPESVAPSPAFAVSHVETASVGTSTAIIVWKTNEAATSQVLYGRGESYASTSAVSFVRGTSHEVRLSGLTPGTNYFYKVLSQNISGKTAEKSGFEFNTLFKQKITATAPVISNLGFESVGTSTAVILFLTDKAATGEVYYGTTTGYEQTDGGHTTFLTNHRHPLSGLLPDTLYDFEVVVRNASGGESIYENALFKTLPQASVAVSAAPAVASAPSSGGGNIPSPASMQGGGGYYPHPAAFAKVVAKPHISKVEPLDKQALFIWQRALPASGVKTVIVRGEKTYPVSLQEGSVRYEGNSGRFADVDLENGTTYYYSVFRINQAGIPSSPVSFAVVPRQGKTQAMLNATPPVVQKTPIYIFSKELSRGDNHKEVEHLQVLLASESSLYPQGLITGYFGPLTEGAVTLFQKRYKLQASGTADTATLKKLEQLSGVEAAQDKASPYERVLSRNLALGMSGEDVSVLQQFLSNADVYPEALVSGYFGSLTKSALERFQQEQNIAPAYGYFGPVSKKRMLNLIRLGSVSF